MSADAKAAVPAAADPQSGSAGDAKGQTKKAKSKTAQFTARRTVTAERHLWFTDVQGRSRVPVAAAAGAPAPAPAQRDVEDVCVTLREYDTAAAVNGCAALVDATPRAGLSAAMAAAHLVAKLRLPVVADFVSSEFPVSVSIVRGEVANAVRIHGDARVCVLVTDVKFAASSTGDAVVRLLTAHVTDFCARHGIAQLITIDGKGKQSAGAGRSAGSGGAGGGGGGGGGGGDDDDDDDDDDGEGNVEVDLDALGGDDDDGDDGGDDSAGASTRRALGAAPVRVQPTGGAGGSGSGSGKAGAGAGSASKTPAHAHHKSDGKDKDPPKHANANAKAKDKAKGKGKGGDKKSKADADDDDGDDDSDSASDSDSSDSSESDSDADADAAKAADGKESGGKGDAKAKGKASAKGKGKGGKESDKDKGKEKKRADRILFVTNDAALAVRLRSAEFKPAPVTDAAASAYTPKPSAANAAAAEAAAAAASAGMSVRLRAWKDGTVRGLTGAVLECAPVTALRVVGLFAAGGSKSLTDVRLSVELIKAVVALCGLQVSTGHGADRTPGIRVHSLAKAARRIETKVRTAVKELTDQHTKSKRVMQSMYG